MKGYKLSKIGLYFIIVLLIFAIIVASAVALLSNDIIQPNISISGIGVSGLTRNEAITRLNNIYEEKISEAFVLLKFEDKEWKISYKDLGYSYNIEEAVDKAYNIGHSGNVFKKLSETINTRFNKEHKFQVESKYNTEPVNKLVDQIEKEINQEVIDATIQYKGNSFVISDERTGRILNKEAALTSITNQLHKVEVSILELPVEIIEPVVKKADLAHVKDKLGEFSTKFNAADVDRSINIKVATKSASNVLVRSGEVYSVNETIGPRLAKYGYKDAKVIINNELVPGIGGGVCQVSSTLYNAVLLSNLKIVERQNHTLTSSYVELGRDATISGDYIDFKFMNNTDYPIYIYGEIIGNRVKFTVFGKNEHPGRYVKITTNVVKTIQPEMKIINDATMPVGTENIEKKAHIGYVVKTERIVYENGKQILRETIGTSNYRVVNGVKRVGTKPVAPPVVSDDPTVPTQPPIPPGTNG